jgi:hypothetical protein
VKHISGAVAFQVERKIDVTAARVLGITP